MERKHSVDSFPDFMKKPKNRIDPAQQNTADIEGYWYEAADGSQMAFWECRASAVNTWPVSRIGRWS
jgi:hypothetical protein